MTQVEVVAPLDGEIVGLAGVPDPVFRDELVGAGTAIAPPADAATATVGSPIAGTLAKVHPHAFVVVAASDGVDVGVLVHLGIDTVRLGGAGFSVLAEEQSTVAAGEPVLTVDLAHVRAQGLSTVCPVVVLDAPAGSVSSATGTTAVAGGPLFTWAGP